MWDILRMYGVGGSVVSASVCVNGQLNENFIVGVVVRYGCVMSS